MLIFGGLYDGSGKFSSDLWGFDISKKLFF